LKPNAVTQQLLRLRIDGQNTMNDETVLYFEANATNGFDELYDASKLRGNDPFAPALAIYSNALAFQINGVAPLAGTYTMDVLATTGYSGTYTLSAVSFSSLPKGTCFSMFDRATSTTFDLSNANYVFYLADTTTAPRFKITLTNTALATNEQHQVPTCSNANGGKVIVGAQNAGPWNYTWSLNGQVVKTSTNKTSADTLSNLSGGTVEVDVFTAGACDYGYQTVVLPSMEFATAAFVCDDSAYVNMPVAFTNSCVNTQSYTWNFGDGLGTSSATDPVYTFVNSGTYKVRLVAGSSTSCNDTVTKNVRILEPTGIAKSETITSTLTVKTLGDKHFQLLRNYSTNETRTLKVVNMAGSTVKSVTLNTTSAVDYELNLSDVQDGLYILQIDSKGTQEYRKLVVTK
jgi:PKD repeat protein